MNKSKIIGIIFAVYLILALSIFISIPENPNYNYVTLEVSIMNKIVDENSSVKVEIKAIGGNYYFNTTQFLKFPRCNEFSYNRQPDFICVYYSYHYLPLPPNLNNSCEEKLFNIVSQNITEKCINNKSAETMHISNYTVYNLSNQNRVVIVNINTSKFLPGFYFIRVNDFKFYGNHLMNLKTETLSDVFEVTSPQNT